jgi:hypothetical protein
MIFVAAVLVYAWGVTPRVSAQAPKLRDFTPGFEGSLALGYIHTMGGITTVWKDGGEAEFSLGYRFRPFFGFDGSALLGFTGMTDLMKNSVAVVGTYGDTSTQSDSGGLYMCLLAGPSIFHAFPTGANTSVRVALSGGGARSWQMESGISADGYEPRWTMGWGGFGGLRIDFLENAKGAFWGLQFRYIYTRSLVNDFYYDRYYGMSSYDEIPPTFTDDQRLLVSIELGGLL